MHEFSPEMTAIVESIDRLGDTVCNGTLIAPREDMIRAIAIHTGIRFDDLSEYLRRAGLATSFNARAVGIASAGQTAVCGGILIGHFATKYIGPKAAEATPPDGSQ